MSDIASQAKETHKKWCVSCQALGHHRFWYFSSLTFVLDKDASTRRRICSFSYLFLEADILRWCASETNNIIARGAALSNESSVARHFARITRTAAHLLIISRLQDLYFSSAKLAKEKKGKARNRESSIHPSGDPSEVAAVAHC